VNSGTSTTKKPIRNAYFIKLGEGGKWELDSIRREIARIGWTNVPLEDITSRNWDEIKRLVDDEIKDKGAATRDLKALQRFVESTPEDVWITFHKSCLWWCRLEGPVEKDDESKFRRTIGPWCNKDVDGKDLSEADLPGELSKVQSFRGTVCEAPKDDLSRVLNCEFSKEHTAVESAANDLVSAVEKALVHLHWKDFETLVDLIFHNAGWRRLSILGESMQYADMVLEEPITGDRYQVQVKSEADVNDLHKYSGGFNGKGAFRKLFFVVHSPKPDLAEQKSTKEIEIVLPKRLAQMVVGAGLTTWLLGRCR
jgi:hypothetical protein